MMSVMGELGGELVKCGIFVSDFFFGFFCVVVIFLVYVVCECIGCG